MTTAARGRRSTPTSSSVVGACSTSAPSTLRPSRRRPLPPLRPPHRDPQSHKSDSLVALAGPAGGGVGSKAGGLSGEEVNSPARLLLVGVGVAYVSLILLLPALNVFYQAFRNGVGPFIENVLDPDFLHACKMTGLMAACAVPINTIWGVAAALLIARNEFRWKPALLSILDLPFSISPVVAGMMLVLLYGRQGLFAPVLKVRRCFFERFSRERGKSKEKQKKLTFSFSLPSKKLQQGARHPDPLRLPRNGARDAVCDASLRRSGARSGLGELSFFFLFFLTILGKRKKPQKRKNSPSFFLSLDSSRTSPKLKNFNNDNKKTGGPGPGRGGGREDAGSERLGRLLERDAAQCEMVPFLSLAFFWGSFPPHFLIFPSSPFLPPAS